MDWVLGIATIVLAVLTGWYATLTKKLADYAAESVEAARRSALAAEDAVLAQGMPVVVARSGGGSMKSFSLTLQNLSDTAAIDVVGRLLDADGQEIATIRRTLLGPRDDFSSGVGEDSSAVMTTLRQRSGFAFEAIYANAYGRTFRTMRETTAPGGEPTSKTSTYIADPSDPGGWRKLT